jgi:amidase
MSILMGRYLTGAYNGRFYARAQNLARSLREGNDSLLGRFDILAWPTTPMKARTIPDRGAPLDQQVLESVRMIQNTCPLNITGHPAINVPCAISEGLPIGMMFVGRIGDDAAILRAADAFQRGIYAPPAPPRRA